MPDPKAARLEFEREVLDAIPTILGRLIYFAGLRRGGVYEELGLADRVGSEFANISLSNWHRRAVEEWLHLRLENRKQDLLDYLATAADATTLLNGWRSDREIRKLLPEPIAVTQRDLFVSDFKTLVMGLGQWPGDKSDAG
jgi:hypothetical protein